jgi:hypothetical protein
LRYTNVEESYTDHVFINADLWEGIITDDEVTLPGNIVFFDGIVYPLQ